MLFVITVEFLGTRIREKNVNTKGIEIGKNNIEIDQLADDTTLLLKSNEIQTVLNVVEEFGVHSGLKSNRKKTKGLLPRINKDKPK